MVGDYRFAFAIQRTVSCWYAVNNRTVHVSSAPWARAAAQHAMAGCMSCAVSRLTERERDCFASGNKKRCPMSSTQPKARASRTRIWCEPRGMRRNRPCAHKASSASKIGWGYSDVNCRATLLHPEQQASALLGRVFSIAGSWRTLEKVRLKELKAFTTHFSRLHTQLALCKIQQDALRSAGKMKPCATGVGVQRMERVLQEKRI